MSRDRLRLRIASAIIVGALTIAAAPAASADTPSYHPTRLSHLGAAEQVIVVTAPSSRSTHATLRTYEKDDSGDWVPVLGTTPARLGWSGLALAEDRRQGTGKTPAGTFAITRAFGRQPDPGTELAYRQVDGTDAWTYNPDSPSTYNVLQTADVAWRTYRGYVEHLRAMGRQYDYVAVLDYNLPKGPFTTDRFGIRRTATPANTRAGGGIFLHVSKGESTAGCIAIPRERMRAVMRWLDPSRHPVIVIGTEADITRM